MSKNVLITGGAGFIGSHLANELLNYGYRVRVLDNLCPQVHGAERKRPGYLNPEVELQVGDVRDAAAVTRALQGVDSVYHFVAAVGVGQSMYEIAEYTSVNNVGTAVLLEGLLKCKNIQRLVVASSMSIYGEGLYKDSQGQICTAVDRSLQQVKAQDWEVRNEAGDTLTPVPTPETKTPTLASVYALSKYDQEQMCLMIGRAYQIPTVALRFFNIFGPNQALSNPYTGVLAIFASRLLNNRAPLINEDGLQKRDFVSVYDVARACRLALENEKADSQVFNIASGKQYTVRELAEQIARVLGRNIAPEITGKYRAGDIRHCFADIAKARDVLGFEPCVGLEEGLQDLAAWLEGQIAYDRVAESRKELAARRLDGMSEPVLIFGGAGFIGTNLASRLLSAGQPVLIYDDLSRPGVERNLEWLKSTYRSLVDFELGDIRDARLVRRCVRQASAVFHLAAQTAVTTSVTNPREDFDVNLLGAITVLEELRALRFPVPLLFTSTNKVYGDLNGIALRQRGSRYEPQDPDLLANGIGESCPLSFHSPYGCSKGAADQYVLDYARTYNLPNVVFRMSCIYGPHQCGTEDQGWVAHFLLQAIARQQITLYGDGMQVRDVLFAEDLVDAMLLAQKNVQRLAGHAFNIGGGPSNTTSLIELLDLIGKLQGYPAPVRFDDWRVGDQRYYVSDTRAFQSATGWKPRVGVQEGVSRLHNWLLENNVALPVATRRGVA